MNDKEKLALAMSTLNLFDDLLCQIDDEYYRVGDCNAIIENALDDWKRHRPEYFNLEDLSERNGMNR